MRPILKLVFRFRLPIIVLTVLLTLFFSWHLRNIRVESDVINYLPRSDPAVSLYHYINDNFGGNELALVAVEDSAVF
jgi:hypothetical protein